MAKPVIRPTIAAVGIARDRRREQAVIQRGIEAPLHPRWRLDLDCADICTITGRIMTRRTGSDDEVIRRMLSVCAAACRLCAEECQKHAAMHEHCRICAESCRRCMEACQELARGMAH